MTLVEAAVATAILGSLLSGLVLAGSGFTRQSRGAERRRQACRIADDLLNRWWLDVDTLPRNSSGPVPDEPGWTWRTRVSATAAGSDLAAMGGEIVAVEIVAPGIDRAPACLVELVLPVAKDHDE